MFLKLYLIALPIFLAIDMVWLSVVSKRFYAKQIGQLMKPKVNWPPTIIFYLIFTTGLVFFAISPAVEAVSWSRALTYGALFGLVAYATYDLSNLAVLEGWPAALSAVDILWGTALSGSVAALTYFIATRL